MTPISLGDLFRRAIDVLNQERIPYFVYGDIAVPAWGQVVLAEEADIVVRVQEADVARILGAFRRAGFFVPEKADTLFFIDTWMVASLGGRDVDLALGATEFDTQALQRAVRVRLYDRDVPIATAEDLILYKLVAFRRKDLAHIEDILIRQTGKLDLVYLRDWARRIAEATGKFEVPATLEKMLAEQGM